MNVADAPDQTGDAPALLEVRDLVKHFGGRRHRPTVHALCGISFDLLAGETLAIVGESGSGKTTLLRSILGLERPTAGDVRFQGNDVTGVAGAAGREFRSQVSVVFQDPYTSLDPRMTVGDIIREPQVIQGLPRRKGHVAELLAQVRLPADAVDRFPHEFSGGQRQRIAIARALAVEPAMIVLDEPVSALDVSVQAEILALLRQLQNDHGMAYLFVSHDMGVVAELSHRVGVMHGGQMVELGGTADVIRRPQHPYTSALLAAVPVPDPEVQQNRMLRPPPVWPTAESPAASCPYDQSFASQQ